MDLMERIAMMDRDVQVLQAEVDEVKAAISFHCVHSFKWFTIMGVGRHAQTRRAKLCQKCGQQLASL